jgi:molybdopterin-containing oxidoreductase family iron-sulfur binding subunit
VPYADAMHLETKPFDPADDGRDPDYRWGLTLDLDACTGCNACITACVQENNIPTIGETIVRQGREMHWIRMERYVEHAGDAVQVYHVPMMCQHCGSAPCETVCPVFATYHNDQGLNVMVYNRCIGTRYCSNNCPYKVRRFNYFPYDTLIRDPEQLALNPDVTVRSKGVMEKCSMCVQRINGARDTAIVEGRTIREGEFTTACAQTCPSNAITFGNYKDPESQVTKNNRDPRAYWVFHHLNTRPGVTYLKSIDRSEKV